MARREREPFLVTVLSVARKISIVNLKLIWFNSWSLVQGLSSRKNIKIMNTGIKVLLGIVGGVAAGLCIGLLVAPDKGSKTRKKIASMADDWTGKWKNLFHDGQQRPAKKKKPYSRHVARPKGRTSHA